METNDNCRIREKNRYNPNKGEPLVTVRRSPELAQLESLVDALCVPLVVCRPDGELVTGNPAGLSALGIDESHRDEFSLASVIDGLQGIFERLRDNPEQAQLVTLDAGTPRTAKICLWKTAGSAQEFALVQFESARDSAQAQIASLARFPSENPNPVLRASPEGRLLYVNPAGRRFDRSEDQGFVPKDWRESVRHAYSSGHVLTLSVEDGDRCFALTLAPVSESGYVNIYGRDTTHRLAAEALVRQSLEEKTLLLKEVHHRVKNNLQVVIGMLQLQRRLLRTAEAISVLDDSANRIRVMSKVHQKIYEHDNLARIDLADYLRSILEDLLGVYATSVDQIRLDLQVDNVPVDIEMALVAGQLLNELMTNSLKYAFPGGRKGCICVQIGRSENGDIESIGYEDDGIGVAPGTVQGLGTQLVHLLASQLRLEVTVDDAAPGVCYRFEQDDTQRHATPVCDGSILLVEDELLIAEARKYGLRAMGLRVNDVAPSAEEALQYFENQTKIPSLVITDINLGPGVDGIHLARKIKADHPSCHVVFVSGYSRKQYEQDLASFAGEVVWLDKNVSDQILARTAQNILKSTS